MTPSRLRALRVAAALIVLAGMSCFERAAEASCGDWLMSHGPAAPVEGGGPPSETPPVAPCDGPQCSHAPLAPAAPAPEITVEVERWACVAEALRRGAGSSSPLLAEARLVLPARQPSGVFRPPR